MSKDASVRRDETLYRQLRRKLDPPFFESGSPPVPPTFFTPSSSDETGLSVIRATHRHERWSGTRPEQPGEAFKLAVLPAAGILDAGTNLGFRENPGLTVVLSSDRLDERFNTQAHAEIVELSARHRNGQMGSIAKRRFRLYRNHLREVVCRRVIGPFPLPDHRTPIRPEPTT